MPENTGSTVGTYDHLDQTCPVRLIITDTLSVDIRNMPLLVESVLASNYGLHRFLSELIRQTAEDPSELMRAIRIALEEGATK
jgi:hypothetical protein